MVFVCVCVFALDSLFNKELVCLCSFPLFHVKISVLLSALLSTLLFSLLLSF